MGAGAGGAQRGVSWVGEARVGEREEQGARRPGLCPRSRQQGVPELTPAPQAPSSMCAHTHPNTRAAASTRHTSPHYPDSPETLCTHASTQGHTRVRTHTHTQAHTRTHVQHVDRKPSNTARKHVQALEHTHSGPPHLSTGFFQLVGGTHLRVWPHCLFCKPQRTRPLWTRPSLFPPEGAASKILEP